MTHPSVIPPPNRSLNLASHRAGGATITMLILALIACTVVGSLLNLSSSDIRMTSIALDQQKALLVAEAGLDYGVMRLRDLVKVYRLNPAVSLSDLQDTLSMIPAPPTLPGPYVYASPNGTTFKITADGPVMTGILTNGNHVGQDAVYQPFTVTCGVSNTVTGRKVVLRQHLQAISLFVVRFAVFYQDTLEINPGNTMDMRGAVHCNGTMYLGPDSATLTFWDRVTCAANVFCRRLDRTEKTSGTPRICNAATNPVNMLLGGSATVQANYLDSAQTNFAALALLRWQGQLLTGAHGVAKLTPPIDPLASPHAIIERSIPPPATGTNPLYNATTEAAKFSNRAAIRIKINSNNTVSVTDFFSNTITRSSILGTNALAFTNLAAPQISGTYSGAYADCTNLYQRNAKGNYALSETGMIGIGTSFYDAREKTNMAPVDIYLDQLLLNFPDLYQTYTIDQGQSTIYITRDKSTTDPGKQPCVRIRNGDNLLTALTIASDLPLYVDGNFNVPSSTNTTALPVCVAADVVTLLSSVWQDAKSKEGSSIRDAASTTYNVVIMSGNNNTVKGGKYNGGLENELRFLEDWAGKTVRFRGSIINLWNGQIAKGDWGANNSLGQFIYGVPGTRDWGYDPIYRYANPPCMTKVFGMEEVLWERVDWENSGL